MNFQELRKKYPTIIYKKYEIFDNNDEIKVKYTYLLEEYTFTPSITINKKDISNNQVDQKFLSFLFFNYGLVDLINYYKLSCPKQIVIEAGYLNNEQINFFKKLIYNGLGEYFYRNNISLSYDEFTTFVIKNNKHYSFTSPINTQGNLILIGGGKDSIVSLSLLQDEKDHNSCFLFERNIYPKNIPSYLTIKTALYNEKQILTFKTEIDPLLLELNHQGFLNGHVPFSSQLAFASYIMAYLNNKKYIITSNEASSNEGNIIGSNINHQYSKSMEFENDFRAYTLTYFTKEIEYFSLLRPLLEIQIAKIFSHYPQYFNVFRSCNLSSKKEGTNWCGHCPKCLFIFIILSPYIDQETLIKIFNKNLLDDPSLLDTFLQLLGKSANKPFECVGTYQEVQYACTKTIEKLKKDNLPFLLDYFLKHEKFNHDDLDHYWNSYHNVPKQYLNKIRKELNFDDQKDN